MSLSKSLSSLALFMVCTYGHSWLHCSDYDGVITGQDFDESKCNGYIRGWQSIWGATSFSTDRGVNYQASGSNWCQSGFSSDIDGMYDNGYPPATWHYNEEITLVWPAKNHANYECFNNIPDTSMKLYYNPIPDPDSQPSSSSIVTQDWTLLIDWQEGCTPGQDGCGFQNCPKFCENTDDAPCFGKYTVSQEDFPNSGYYTLMWYWIFNPGTPYTTCFEIYIDGENTGDNNDDNTDTSDDTNTNTDTNADTNDSTNDDTNDTNGDTNDDTNGDNNDDDATSPPTGKPTESNDGSIGGSTDYEFIVEVPVCYTDAMYDQNNLISGANSVNYDDETSVSWRVLYVTISEVDGIEWNAIIQTHTNSASDVTSLSYNYADGSSDLCDSIESVFGSGDCYICDPGEMKAYIELIVNGGDNIDDSDETNTIIDIGTTGDINNDENDDGEDIGDNNEGISNASKSSYDSDDSADAVIVALVIIIIVLLIIIGSVMLYSKFKSGKNSSRGSNGNEAIITTISNQPTQVTQGNIVLAED